MIGGHKDNFLLEYFHWAFLKGDSREKVLKMLFILNWAMAVF